MSVNDTATPRMLTRATAEGIEVGGRRLPVVRAWLLDLDSPEEGYALELADPDGMTGTPGVVAARLDETGIRVAADDPVRDRLGSRALREGRVVAHRLRRRAVAELPDGTFVKAAKPAATARALDRLGAVETLVGNAGDETMPRRPAVLDADAEAGRMRLARAPGDAFTTLVQAGDPRGIERALAAVARGVVAIATVDAGPGSPASGGRPNAGLPNAELPHAEQPHAEQPHAELPTHTCEDEAGILIRWARALPGAPRLSEAVVRRVQGRAQLLSGRLRERDEGTFVLAHRDLHDAQILYEPGEPGRVTFLDWDTASWAPPGLDAANLLAHLDRAEDLSRIPAGAAARFEELCVAQGHPGWATAAEAERTALLRAASRLRVACVHAFRPGPVDPLLG